MAAVINFFYSFPKSFHSLFSRPSKTDKLNHMSHGESNSTTMGQLRARRKASKMLVAVVMMFAFCYLPVHALNIIRFATTLDQSEVISVLSLLSHWLCYANSAVNPLIYNFMSGEWNLFVSLHKRALNENDNSFRKIPPGVQKCAGERPLPDAEK